VDPAKAEAAKLAKMRKVIGDGEKAWLVRRACTARLGLRSR
jgi:hypothetical protein